MASEIDQTLQTPMELEDRGELVDEKKLESDNYNKLKKLLEQNKFVLDKKGVGKYVTKIDPLTEEKYEDIEYFIDTPVKIVATSDDLDTDQNLYKLLIIHPVSGKIEVWEEQSDITTRNGLKEISCDGLIFDDSLTKDVLSYFRTEIYRASIEEERIAMAKKTGWKRDNTIFVSGNIAYEKRKKYEISNLDEENKYVFVEKGNIEDWKEGIKDIIKSKMARICLYTSVAAQVNGILKQPSILLLLFGKTSTGKTLCAMVAVSMNGNPMQITKSADSTPTGFERAISYTEGFCNVFDEADENFSKNIYKFVNGRGRQRGNTNGREIPESWNKSCIVTSEAPINKESDAQGQIGRVIECSNWLLPNNPELAKKVEGTIRNNYGLLTEPIIQKIFEQKDNLQPRYEEICKKLPLVSVDAGNRIRDSFALLILAGEILESVFADIGIETQDPYKLCEELYLENVDDDRKIPYWQRALKILFEEVITSRRERDDMGIYQNKYSLYGKTTMVLNGEYIDLLISPMKEICKKHELKYEQIVKEWKKENITVCDNGKDTRRSRNYGYVVRIKIDSMNNAINTDFNPEEFANTFIGSGEEESKEFEVSEPNIEERRENMIETMVGTAIIEKEEADERAKQKIEPRKDGRGHVRILNNNNSD